jgi:sec-independent protein translocase protein TatB
MNVLGMGPMELLLIVVLALIVFGPSKLPEIMGQVGKAINDFRRATSNLSDEFNRTIQAELQEGRSVLNETKSAVADVHTTVNSAVAGVSAPVRTAVPEGPPTPNGTSIEVRSEPATNGALPEAVKPPLADTAQWSWETAAPPSEPEPPSAPPPAESPAPDQAVDPSPVEPPPASKERAARDDIVPPY